MHVIILDKKTRDEHYTDYETVNLYEHDSAPLRWLTNKREPDYSLGSIVEVDRQQEQIVREISKYQDHEYEYATVLGHDAQGKRLYVYGYKIREETINIDKRINVWIHNYDFYTPGTFLLLKQENGIWGILHHISTQRLKEPINTFGQRTR